MFTIKQLWIKLGKPNEFPVLTLDGRALYVVAIHDRSVLCQVLNSKGEKVLAFVDDPAYTSPKPEESESKVLNESQKKRERELHNAKVARDYRLPVPPKQTKSDTNIIPMRRGK